MCRDFPFGANDIRDLRADLRDGAVLVDALLFFSGIEDGRQRQLFFASMSCSIALSRLRSATSLFSHRFSR